MLTTRGSIQEAVSSMQAGRCRDTLHFDWILGATQGAQAQGDARGVWRDGIVAVLKPTSVRL